MPENENNAVSEVAAEEKKDLWTQTWEQLEQGVQDFMTSEKFADYLKCVSSFYRYSVNNTVLIAMQDPEATMVGSFTFWKSKGRYVEKGQHGIKIIAPAPVKQKVEVEKTDPRTGEILVDASGNPMKEQVEKTIPRFKVVTVFDVRQTAGEPLPELGIHELEGSVDNFTDFMIAIQKVSPVPIRFAEIEGGAKGYYHLENKEIVIQSGMSESQTMKTCIHEVSHAYLHDRDVMKAKGIVKDAQTKEVEAESVAFCVMNAFKIDSSAYSFPYIGSWSSGKDLKELKASMDTIRVTSGELIDKLNEQLDALVQERAAIKEKEMNQLAVDIDWFSYEYNTRGDKDTLEERESAFAAIRDDFYAGDISGIRNWLDEVANDEEFPQEADQARQLLERLDKAFGKDTQQLQTEKPVDLSKQSITFYVAECAEFPVMGEYHENLSLQEALDIYDKMPNDRIHGVKGMGFELHDGTDYVEKVELCVGGVVQKEMIDNIPYYKDSPLVQEAVMQVEKHMNQRASDREQTAFGQVVQKSVVAEAQPNRIALKTEANQTIASDKPIRIYMEDVKESVLGRLSANKEVVKQQDNKNKNTKTHDKTHSKGGQVIG